MTIESSLYKKIHDTMPILCVDIIILKNNTALLVKRTNEPAKNEYWFPGGRVHKFESLEDAAKRKVKEEVNLDVKNIKLLGSDETIFDTGPFGKPTHTVNFVYSAKITLNQEIKLDSQSEKYYWCEKIDTKLNPYVTKFLKLVNIKEI